MLQGKVQYVFVTNTRDILECCFREDHIRGFSVYNYLAWA